jgi:hypothetical protein
VVRFDLAGFEGKGLGEGWGFKMKRGRETNPGCLWFAVVVVVVVVFTP